MTTIVTRAGKGSPLTHAEVDTNFTNLNTAKLETAAIPLGTLQAPSVSFLNDSDTGIFCPQGGNSLAVATGGQYAITCTSTQAVGIKTANPSTALHVAGNARVGADDVTDAHLQIGKGATGNRNSYIDIVGDTTYTDYGLRIIRNNTGANATSELKHRGTGALNFTTQEAAPIVFNTTNSPALTITSGGLVGIGTSSPQALCHVSGGNILLSNAYYLASRNAADNASLSLIGRDTSNNVLIDPDGYGIKVGGTTLVTTSTGRVGIGTTDARGVLRLAGSSANAFPNNGGVLWLTDTNAATDYKNWSVSSINGEFGVARASDAFNTAQNAYKITGAATQGYIGEHIWYTNNSSEKVRIDNSGRLLVGTSNARANFYGTYAPQYQIEGTGLGSSMSSIISNRNDAGQSYLVLAKTRGAAVGSNTVVQSGDYCGTLSFQGADGTNFIDAASIDGVIEGTVGANRMPGRLVFSTATDASPSVVTEAMRIDSFQQIKAVPTYNNASALASNLGIASNGNIYRSTSSAKYKIDIETIQESYSDALLACRPVWYRSICPADRSDYSYWGFIAEEVAAIDPRLVHWKTIEVTYDEKGSAIETTCDPEPEGVAYDRFVPHLLNLIKRQKEQIEAMEARLSALEAA